MPNQPSQHAAPPPLSPALGDAERRYVYSVAMKYVRDPDAADDVTQDAMLLAHRHRDSYRGDARYSTWLYRVAATTALMYLRRRRRQAREQLATDEDAALGLARRPDPAPGPADLAAAREGLAEVARQLDDLAPLYREVVLLRLVGGLSDAETAAALGLGVAAIKTRTHRARTALRRVLGDAWRNAA
jgi:RNA polymerase sigma factor (sigma-70 family)